MCDLERFWAKVDKSGECWVWTGTVLKRWGYGTFWAAGQNRRAHRWVWQYLNGQIPAGMYVCHRCDNPRCVRPEHLFLGTPSDNQHDESAKGRHWAQRNPEKARAKLLRSPPARGERVAGAKLTEDDVIVLRFMSLFGVTETKLAKHFGLAPSAARKAAMSETWKHVPDRNALRAALAARGNGGAR